MMPPFPQVTVDDARRPVAFDFEGTHIEIRKIGRSARHLVAIPHFVYYGLLFVFLVHFTADVLRGIDWLVSHA